MKGEQELERLIAAKARYEQTTKMFIGRRSEDTVSYTFLANVPDDAAEFVSEELKKLITTIQEKALIDYESASAEYVTVMTEAE